jgi:ABC-type uncharacterized transport system substrate-binding protein
MKKWTLACSFLFLIVGCSQAPLEAKMTKVEILYMNHGPLMDTIDNVRDLLAKHGNKINVSWYDFESSEGERFMAEKRITRHIPLIIWIDGSPSVKLRNKEITFIGFPSGSGPAFFQGNWSMDNLREALLQATGRK